MADNTALNPGVGGDTIADEDIAGVKYQKIKLIDATVGSTAPIGTTANPLPVTAASLPLPTGGATSANQTTEIASLANLDVALSTRLKPADTLAGVTALGSITGALPTGANIIGKVGIDQTTPGTTNKVYIGTDGVVQANAGTNLNTSLLALESGGNLATIAAAIHSEDMPSVDLDKGIPALAVRQDMPDTDTSMTADYSWIKTDAKGRLWINSDVLGDILRQQNSALLAILAEQRVQTAVLAEGLSVRTDLDSLRTDPYYNPTLQ